MTKTTWSLFLFVLISTIGSGSKGVSLIRNGREQDCRSCHRFTRTLSHVVDKRVQEDAGLPLLRGNRIGCQTCHMAGPDHGKVPTGAPAKAKARQENRSRTRVQLRRSGRELCESCHQESTNRGHTLDHALMLGRAHLESKTGRGQNDDRRMDAETRTCLECHDGSVATDTGHEKVSRGRRMSREHPIGMKFKRRSRGSNLRSRGALPRTIRLPGGRVGCGSCHSPFSGEEKMLAVTPKQGRLCLSCHDM